MVALLLLPRSTGALLLLLLLLLLQMSTPLPSLLLPFICCFFSSLHLASFPALVSDRASAARLHRPRGCACNMHVALFALPPLKSSYADTRRIGENWSTPKNGSCAEGARVGDNGCTWSRHPFARIVFGQQLLDNGWNATAVAHWPLHEHGPNQTTQYYTNLPVFDATWQALDKLLAPRCCGC